MNVFENILPLHVTTTTDCTLLLHQERWQNECAEFSGYVTVTLGHRNFCQETVALIFFFGREQLHYSIHANN